MSTKFGQLPVTLPSWQEVLRRVATAVNYLLQKVPTNAAINDPSQAGFSMPAGSPGTIIENWVGLNISSDYAEVDMATGRITVQEVGLYRVDANIVFGGGTNNVQYALETVFTIEGTEVRTLIDASPIWQAQYTAMVVGGSRTILLGEDDYCQLAMFADSADTIELVDGEFFLEQVT